MVYFSTSSRSCVSSSSDSSRVLLFSIPCACCRNVNTPQMLVHHFLQGQLLVVPFWTAMSTVKMLHQDPNTNILLQHARAVRACREHIDTAVANVYGSATC